jgi:putative chitinase
MFGWFEWFRKKEEEKKELIVPEENKLINVEQLKKMIPTNQFVGDWTETLNHVLPEYEINTPDRIAMFVAQCGHESMDFRVLQENLNYRWESLRRVFPKYFPTDALAQEYASKPNKQEAIANRVYGNRMGNGPEESGDGFRYSGKGLIQLTGKYNYTNFADSIGMSLEEVPEYLVTFEGAVKSACWFWNREGLNSWSDQQDVRTVTKKINGGFHGLDDRILRYDRNVVILNQ